MKVLKWVLEGKPLVDKLRGAPNVLWRGIYSEEDQLNSYYWSKHNFEKFLQKAIKLFVAARSWARVSWDSKVLLDWEVEFLSHFDVNNMLCVDR